MHRNLFLKPENYTMVSMKKLPGLFLVLKCWPMPNPLIRFGGSYLQLQLPHRWCCLGHDASGRIYRGGGQRFNDYANRYTDFMIDTKPFVKYQMETLNEYNSVNHHMMNVPLLDFTLAPSLPFYLSVNSAR